jgi:hypothetical protein
MKVLSFDVGIRNLAYCCIEYTPEWKKIIAWNIINLIPDSPHCYISSCNKPVIQSCLYHGHPVNWCEKHKKYYNVLLALEGGCTNELTKPTNVTIINCKNIETDDLRKSIIRNLDIHILPLVFKFSIDYVLVENQPVKKNPLMKQVMDTIYCWFLMRCMMYSSIVKKIYLISPSNKLKQYAAQLGSFENREKYKATKQLSIDVVYDYIKQNKLSFLQEHLDKFTKKDDLCDSMLQGFYWIDKVFDEIQATNNKEEKKRKAKEVKELKEANKVKKINKKKVIEI